IPADDYSSHSLRRGFATWAAASGWDLKALMHYVGWRDMKSALRYVDATTSFGGLALTEPASSPPALTAGEPKRRPQRPPGKKSCSNRSGRPRRMWSIRLRTE